MKLKRPANSASDADRAEYEAHCRNIATIIAAVVGLGASETMRNEVAEREIDRYLEKTDAG